MVVPKRNKWLLFAGRFVGASTQERHGGSMKNIGNMIGGCIGFVIGSATLIILGLIFIAVGAEGGRADQNAKQNYVQGTAVVTGNESHPYKQYYYYCAEFKFQTRDGQTISVKQADSTDFPCASNVSDSPYYQVGKQVPIYYDPHDPAHTVLLAEDVDGGNGGNIAAVVIGVIMLIIGALLVSGGLISSIRSLAKNRRATTIN